MEAVDSSEQLWHHDLAWSFRRSPVTIVAAALTLICVGAALFSPWLSPQNPFDAAALDLNAAFKPPAWMRGRRARLSPRHRQPGPRHPVDHHARRAHLARRRAGLGRPRAGPGRVPRPALGLSRRPARRVHHARGRRAALLPGDPDRAADRRRGARRAADRAPRRHRHPGPGPLHRLRRLGALRAHRARLDHGRAREGIRAGGARHRPPAARDHAVARAAERDGAGAGARRPSTSPPRSSPRRRFPSSASACRRPAPRSAR